MSAPADRTRALLWVALSYLLAAAAALWAYRALRSAGQPLVVAIGLADVAATLVVFAFSKMFDNSSFYDPYWSLTPVLLAPALACCHAAPGAPLSRRLLVATVVVTWGLRLTWNWVRGWEGLHQEDWRYVALRRRTGRAYWLVSLFGIHLMPTVTVFLGCLPLLPALATGTRPLGLLDAAALLVTAGAVTVETIADEQLRAFRLSHHEPGRILDTGLWAYCRHPNYLGEITFWWGVYLCGLAADPGAFWLLFGPLWVTCLFVFFTVPMIDRRSLERRPGYAEHMRRVPALLPRPWRR